MGSPYRVDSKLIFQEIRIVYLKGFRRRIANVGIALMPVQATDFHLSSIQIKAILAKSHASESKGIHSLIQQFLT